MNRRKKILMIAISIMLITTIQLTGCKDSKKINNSDNNIIQQDKNDKQKDENTKQINEKKLEKDNNSNDNKSNDQLNNQVDKIEPQLSDSQLKEAISVYVEEANIGSSVYVEIKNTQISNKTKYFRILKNNEPISKIADIKEATIIYPAEDIGSTVTIELYDNNNNILASFDIVLLQKK